MDEEERHRGRLRDIVHYFHLLGVAQNVGPNSYAARREHTALHSRP